MDTLGPILIGLVAAAVIIGVRWVLLRVLLRPSYRRLKLPLFFGLTSLGFGSGALLLHDEPLLQIGLGVIAIILLWAALGVALQWPGFRDSPPARFREYQIVRLARMDRSPEEYAGWADDTRLPQLGEMGTIIDIHALGGGRGELVYVVEGPSRDGAPAWIAEFLQDELEPISGKDK